MSRCPNCGSELVKKSNEKGGLLYCQQCNLFFYPDLSVCKICCAEELNTGNKEGSSLPHISGCKIIYGNNTGGD